MTGDGRGAVVVGGGLAGLVAALHLARGGLRVELYEAAERLGGKAGSDWVEPAGRLGYHSDHGYHVFPAWYTNTWALIEDLGIADDFQRRRHFWRLRRPRSGRPRREGLRLRLALRLAQISPRILLTAVDLVSREEDDLVDVSLAEFIETRRYNGPASGHELRDISLKGLGNPADRASSVTFRANMRLLLPVLLRPNWTAARGSLQERFVQPLARAVRDAGVTVHTGTALSGLVTSGSGGSFTVDALVLGDGHRVALDGAPIVLTVPHARLERLLAPHAAALPAGLGRLGDLDSRPMVAADVHLRRRVRGLPREGHVILDGSRLHLTALDIRPVWTAGLPGEGTVLQVIAADTTVLRAGEDPVEALVDDLLEHLPSIRRDDISAVVGHPNDDAPLFMNDVGTDRARPASDHPHGRNLHVAGDWCANPVYLACMEGAVLSAGMAATAVLQAAGRPGPRLHVPSTAPSPRARALRTVLAPIVGLLGRPFDLAHRLRRR